MSKVDAQRAMREAKYARTRASGPTRREAAAAAAEAAGASADAGTPAAPPPPRATAAPTVAPAAAAAPEGELCGHKSMNGRACTRPAGHAEKNHRYG
jgi:hypothetical protein